MKNERHYQRIEPTLKPQAWIMLGTAVLAAFGLVVNAFLIGNVSAALWALTAMLASINGSLTTFWLISTISRQNAQADL